MVAILLRLVAVRRYHFERILSRNALKYESLFGSLIVTTTFEVFMIGITKALAQSQ